MGHVTRALSLARHVARSGNRVRVLSNSPFLVFLQSNDVNQLIQLDPLIELIVFSSSLGRDDLTTASLREIQKCRAQDVVVVDTFPRGVAGELPEVLSDLPAFKVFVHRNLNNQYVREADLEASLADYDLTLVPGEDAPLQQLAQARTGVWMICEPDEILRRAEARSIFGIESEEQSPLVVVSGIGKPAEALEAAELAIVLTEKLQGQSIVRFASLDKIALTRAGKMSCSPWPLVKALMGVDLLIGSGGYHTVYEARATRTPFIGIPQHRLYDRQSDRLNSDERVASLQELVFRSARTLSRTTTSLASPCPTFANGAAEAFMIISQRRTKKVEKLVVR